MKSKIGSRKKCEDRSRSKHHKVRSAQERSMDFSKEFSENEEVYELTDKELI